MKKDKGKQVFNGDTDNILADKIIKHTKVNSKNVSFDSLANDTYCHPPKKLIAVVLALLSSLVLLLMLIRKLKKLYEQNNLFIRTG